MNQVMIYLFIYLLKASSPPPINTAQQSPQGFTRVTNELNQPINPNKKF